MTNRHTYTSSQALIVPPYRYWLSRAWDQAKPHAMFIMLNPSTADAKLDDNTIGRCVDFAKREGFGSIVVFNLFAFRATAPELMMKSPDPVGPENDTLLQREAEMVELEGGKVIAAWGNLGTFQGRNKIVLELLKPVCNVHALHVTRGGHPGHPLYLPGDTPLQLFQERTPTGKEAADGQDSSPRDH